jgi:hypothetical protein
MRQPVVEAQPREFDLMRFVPLAALAAALLVSTAPAKAQSWPLLDRALAEAAQTFARAQGALGASSMGVSTETYGQALRNLRFVPPGGGAPVQVAFAAQGEGDTSCSRFAAYVIPAPAAGTITINLCPQFFASGTDGLRQTTILHELVHVVAGPDECRAMAYTAKLQWLATGTFQPVTNYWRQSGCDASPFSLPG